MKKQIEVEILPRNLNDKEKIAGIIARELKVDVSEISLITPVRRSLDSRKRPVYKILFNVYLDEIPHEEKVGINYSPVKNGKKALVVGFGPGGMYAALRLIELGIKPVIIERGKDVQARRRDIRALTQEHIVNPDSNYCFGEGGAGAYSDGKLYTRSTKRGNVKKILDVLVQHGADPDILIDAHPHIGSNKLPKIVAAIRETILNNGGEIHYNSRVTDFILCDDKIKGIVINNEIEMTAETVLLATGHSARDIYYLLHKNKIRIEPKPFAIGVRIEHPQQLINEIQYHSKNFDSNLPAASYNLACDVNGKGVYSFCMCPGGIVVPSATSPGELVVNGMSISRRDSPFANSGFVVTVDERDWKDYKDQAPFSGLLFQQEIEQKAFRLGGESQKAPAQRATDFVNGKQSNDLPSSSYIPGLTSAPLNELFPYSINQGIRRAFKIFNQRMKGYYTEEAVLIATESRTSSPIRIPRDKETFMHTYVEGLFPCGEGAGYAGGIVSAAIDGENCANAISKYLLNRE